MSYDTSAENSKKLDELIMLIKGENDAPGVLRRVTVHEEILFGKEGQPGLVTKVTVMWRAHVFLLCGLSSIAGFLFKTLLVKFKV